MKLLIGLPSNRGFHPKCAESLVSLGSYLGENKILFTTYHIDSNISQARHEIFAKAKDYTHLLFIDDDMSFSPDAFRLLYSRDKDFVAANALNRRTRGAVTLGKNGEDIFSKDKAGIERITYTGLAFTLIKMEKLKGFSKPLFEVKWVSRNKNSSYLGEDFSFCWAIANEGIELYIDHDAARHVIHWNGTIPIQESFNS